MKAFYSLPLAVTLTLPAPVQGQEAPPSSAVTVYRVDVLVHQAEEGKRVATRSYSMLIENGGKGAYRVGQRVPFATNFSDGRPSQVQYMDVGISIDCSLREQADAVLLDLSLDISDLEPPESGKPAGISPTIRSARAHLNRTAVRPAQKTLVATVDGVVGRQRYEIEVTVSKVK